MTTTADKGVDNTVDRRAGQPVSAAVVVPRVAPQRRWRPALLWLAVALVAVGGLIGWRVLTVIGPSAQYLAVARAVPYGAILSAADLKTVRISIDPGLRPIRAGQASTVIGKHAAVALVPGTLLTPAQLTDTVIPGPGKQLIGISLTQNRLPVQRIKPGAAVRLVITADANAVGTDRQATAPPLTIDADVVDVVPAAKAGDVLLNVAVAERDGPLVAAKAAAGQIVVVLVTGS